MSRDASAPPSPAEAPMGGHPRRWAILGVLVVSLLVVVLDNTVLNVAMKTIADPDAGIGASQSELAWSINSYTLVFAGLLFTFGVLGDRIGRRIMLVGGMVVFGLTSLASAFADTPTQLIWFRAGMGIGAAAILPATLSIISNVFDPRERGKAIGLWAGAVGLGAAIGPVLGGFLLEHFWWGSVFLINVPVVVIGIIAIFMLVPESKDPKPAKLDVVGVLLSIIGLTLLTYGIIEGGDSGDWGQLKVWGTLAGSVVVLVAFVLYERKIPNPALDVTLFRNRMFAGATGTIGLVFFAAMGLMFFFAFYLQAVRQLSPIQTGLLFVPFAAAQLIFAPRSAAMVKKYGARAVSSVGMLIVTASFLVYFTFGTDTPMWLVAVMFFVQGAGMANVMPPATEAVQASVPREKAGVGSAVSNTIRQVGGALGVAVLGSVLSQIYRDKIGPTLDSVPNLSAEAHEAASSSIMGTYGVVEHSGGAADALIAPANDAFISAMHTTTLAAAVIAFIGVIVSWTLLPGKRGGGSQAEAPAAEPVLMEA
ncbi:MFS transporter [Actinorhabdospora filicis]|uniref:MFS transporter n=1 Tax=Actinorhabdospora filicis TaxID=1785913 RepID=A0A9W6SL88_9ACTN|nr:MFS transporter [Actinorhabdospora filicis]GLZ76661.1 MFS transporter [Actinorhabdospora filicis]